MIVVMKKKATKQHIDRVIKSAEEMGFKTHLSKGEEHTIIGIIGTKDIHMIGQLEALPMVRKIVPISDPYKLAGRTLYQKDAVINVGGVRIGGKRIVVMAGPCAVEGRGQLLRIAEVVAKAGARVIRGGAFKPRTSPYSFQGLGEEGLKILREAADRYDLRVVTEVMDTGDVELVAEYADILQIGTRNMQNFKLLKRVGRARRPVFLKRGLSATVEELLMAAEYIIAEGNVEIILCERGIRTFETATRNTLDLAAVPLLKGLSHFPVVVDPSHATGKRDLVAPMCRAAIAAGADGLMVEVHPKPAEAVSDGAQSLDFELFIKMMKDLKKIAKAMGKTI
ncbi:MAG: 3-deoxy-7-phosphoheptulonate synthase [bacterium]